MHTLLIMIAIFIFILAFTLIYLNMLHLDNVLLAKRQKHSLASASRKTMIRISADSKETVRNASAVIETWKEEIPQLECLLEIHRPDQIRKQLRSETIELALIREHAQIELSDSKYPVRFFSIPGNETLPILAWNPDSNFPIRDKLIEIITRHYCTNHHGYADYLDK